MSICDNTLKQDKSQMIFILTSQHRVTYILVISYLLPYKWD
jgi:hypothetical protein